MVEGLIHGEPPQGIELDAQRERQRRLGGGDAGEGSRAAGGDRGGEERATAGDRLRHGNGFLGPVATGE